MTAGGRVALFQKRLVLRRSDIMSIPVVPQGAGVTFSPATVFSHPQRCAVWIWRSAMLLPVLAAVALSAGCILTADIPGPALEIPSGYKAAQTTRADALPKLDWWRGFRSPELTDLMD